MSRRRSPSATNVSCLLEPLEQRRLLSTSLADDSCGCGTASSSGSDPSSTGGSGGYSLIDAWDITNLSYSYSNLLDGMLPGAPDAATIRRLIEEALGVWAAVSPLTFTELPDAGPLPTQDEEGYIGAGTPDLRFGHHLIDGVPTDPADGNTLAHAHPPYSQWGNPNGRGLEGDFHYDNGDSWSINAMLEVGVHEIGHALGLGHANGDVVDGVCPPSFPAVMHACINGGNPDTWNYNGLGTSFLLADDINGITANYGSGLGYVLDRFGTMNVFATQGNNNITLDASGSGFTVNIDGRSFSRGVGGVNELVLHGMGGDDTFIINGTPQGVAVTASGAAGDDLLAIAPNHGNYDDHIHDNIAFTSTDGDDEIIIYDLADNDPGDVYGVGDGHFSKAVIATGILTWDGAEVDSFRLFTSSGDDTILINTTRFNRDYDINGSGGDDTFILATADDDYDASIHGDVDIDGGGGDDSITIWDTADTGHDPYFLTEVNGKWGFSKDIYGYTLFDESTEHLTIHAASGEWNNTFHLLAAPNGLDLKVNAGGGVDTYEVGNGDIDTNMPNTTIGLFGEGRIILDQLNYNDANDLGDGDTYFINSNQVVKRGGGVVTTVMWSNAELNLDASAGGTSFTVNAPGVAMAIQGNAGHDTLRVLAAGDLTINGGTGDDVLDFEGGGTEMLPILFDAGPGADAVSLNDDASLGAVFARYTTPQTLASLSIYDGGRLSAAPGGGNWLSLDNTPIYAGGIFIGVTDFDVADNPVIFRNAAAALASIRLYAHRGYNAGSWDGTLGLRSSTTATTTNQGLGYVTGAQYGGETYQGVPIMADDVIVHQTLHGDTNLDRTVNFADFLRFRSGFGTSGFWINGDSDYNLTVDFADFLRLRSTFGLSLPTAGDGGDEEDDLLA